MRPSSPATWWCYVLVAKLGWVRSSNWLVIYTSSFLLLFLYTYNCPFRERASACVRVRATPEYTTPGHDIQRLDCIHNALIRHTTSGYDTQQLNTRRNTCAQYITPGYDAQHLNTIQNTWIWYATPGYYTQHLETMRNIWMWYTKHGYDTQYLDTIHNTIIICPSYFTTYQRYLSGLSGRSHVPWENKKIDVNHWSF